MLILDGSQGEGGGQILRTSLALSALTGLPFRLEKIRAKRSKPGLKEQHLTSVLAAAEICGAEVSGAALGSKQLTFRPGPVRPGEYAFKVATAGSATLVLQTILPPLMLAASTSRVQLQGGTHNPWAPPFDYLDRVFLPQLRKFGPQVTLTLERPGFFPAGQGRFAAVIEPVKKLKGFEILERGEIVQRTGAAWVTGLPRTVAEREIKQMAARLDWRAEDFVVHDLRQIKGIANVASAEIIHEHVSELCVDFGEKGLPAETVADRVADQMLRYLNQDAPVGEYLADQLLVPLALAQWGRFRTGPLSLHARTNLEVVQQFLPVRWDVTEPHPDIWEVAVQPRD